MDHDAKEAQCLGAIELVDERGDRLLAQGGRRRREVDQVARM
jgi:hypothetical protein